MSSNEEKDTRPETTPGDGEGTQITKPLKTDAAAREEEEAKDDDDEEFSDADSSWVASYRYLKSQGVLEVIFHSGHREQYDVDESTAEGFKTASSKGKFIWKHWPPEH